ncbi:hypothetical protein Q4566_00470 [Tamlana sp. 2_MG-2023]|uniref:hypothetical protein n=1 Tax=unclassified Tamlana TaxID=2614803 RepID=UPI0026E3E752|nr:MULTISPECIES: hypothetical protein [unclassified Tamlana]MDO6758656.1 hypothetical protein [Tamlana sp. 2_MG-2023]MDO6789355.1 hypothetical protein [Tamlana sp. 1_MG-2023]
MEYGFVVLGIVALLFISMYGYSYLSVAQERAKLMKERQVRKDKEEERRQSRLRHQAIIDEKVNKVAARREEIQRELKLLKDMKTAQKVS